MRRIFAAALALNAAASLGAQDLGTAPPLAGTWTYAAVPGGSVATFVDASSQPQLWLRCTRVTRRVQVARPASAAASAVSIWTSTQTRSLSPTFDAAAHRLAVEIAAYDPLLDAIATSRGRVGFTITGQPSLVVPPWTEIARVIEDCRV